MEIGTAGCVVDLFARLSVARGFAAGSRFKPLLLMDNDPVARDNYLANHQRGPYVLADVAALDAAEMLGLCKAGPVAGVLGCPHLPAEPSVPARPGHRGRGDPRYLPPLGERRVRARSPSACVRWLGAGACPPVHHELAGTAAGLVGHLIDVLGGEIAARTSGRYYSQTQTLMPQKRQTS